MLVGVGPPAAGAPPPGAPPCDAAPSDGAGAEGAEGDPGCGVGLCVDPPMRSSERKFDWLRSFGLGLAASLDPADDINSIVARQLRACIIR